MNLPRVVISKGLYSRKCSHCGLLTSVSQFLFLVQVNYVHEVFSIIFSLVGTPQLDSAFRRSWRAESDETKKEIALEKVKGIRGHKQVPQAPVTEGDILILFPGTGLSLYLLHMCS